MHIPIPTVPTLIKVGSAISTCIALGKAATWILTPLVKAIRNLATELRMTHRAFLIFNGEHQLMAEDYCIRNRITRENMRVMAAAIGRQAEPARKTNGAAAGEVI